MYGRVLRGRVAAELGVAERQDVHVNEMTMVLSRKATTESMLRYGDAKWIVQAVRSGRCEELGQRSGAAAAEHVHVEALDDKKKDEADRDLGATMSDRVQRHSGSGAIACVWSLHFRSLENTNTETRTHDGHS